MGTCGTESPELADRWRVHWALNVYPAAGEAGGSLRPARRGPHRRPVGPASDPERARAEGARRARAKVRRYCAANRLNRLGTLTYAGGGCHDPAEFRKHVAEFFRGLKRELAAPLPYLWTGEHHPGGHGLHAHFAVGRYVKQSVIRDVWGRGHVHIKLLGDLPVGSGRLEEARKAARYLAKYVSKSVEDGRPAGLHRYEVGQGFQPAEVLVYGRTADDAIRSASELMGHSPIHVWRSDDLEGWEGPPAVWVQWADGR